MSEERLMQQLLYARYSSSQDYYHSNQINKLLCRADSHTFIVFADVLCAVEQEEFFKRVYWRREYPSKLLLLAEYYKFHRDIPRLFALPTAAVMNQYHDKRRKIEYQRIKLQLAQEALRKNQRIAVNELDHEIR